jgi:hypothetical protein
MADIHGSPGGAPQMPASDAGPAPAPYAGPDLSPEPPPYSAAATGFGAPGAGVLAGIAPGNAVQESGYAHDMNAGLVTPYYGGDISPIQVHGDADAGGRDDVSGTVAGAVHAAEARFAEHEADTHAIGSVIGDIMTLPPIESNPAVGTTDEPWGPFTGTQPPSGTFA